MNNKVLIIDDSQESIQILQAALKKNFEVIPVPLQDSLIKSIESHHPELLLVDLHMPNLDGYEVISQIRRQPLLDDIPIVAMSGTANFQERDRLEKMGIVGFLQKPFYVKSLADQVSSILNGLESTVVSDSKKRVWHNVFSLKHKKRKINHLVRNALNHEHPSIFITWDEPANFLDPDLLHAVDGDQIAFLQIKPNILSRFPYLNNFSSVVDELLKLSTFPVGSAEVVLGDPLRVLQLASQNTSSNQLSQFIREIQFSVDKIQIVHVRNTDEKLHHISQQLARAFIG